MRKRVLLFDTSSLFFRAFHALPAMNTRAGQPTSAIYGLSVQLLQLLREQAPLGIGFALDAPAQTFRHAQYADYKAHRPSMPDPLRQQLQLLRRWLDALGAPCFSVPGFEADDVLARALERFEPHGQENPKPLLGFRGLEWDGRGRAVGDRGLRVSFASNGRRLDAVGWTLADIPAAAPIERVERHYEAGSRATVREPAVSSIARFGNPRRPSSLLRRARSSGAFV